MSFLKSLFKKNKLLELELPISKEFEKPSLPSFEEKPSFSLPSGSNMDSEKIIQYLQLINSKLDLIKLRLENIDQRVKEIEKIAKEETQPAYHY